MKKLIAVSVIVGFAVCSFPASAHAFGILRVIFDGIANAVGLDRGSIPKAAPRTNPQPRDMLGTPLPKNPESQGAYIRAEGF
ncbi:MAG: hypothetical protein ACP5M0_15730 [Desulfomonilaceae bacterium]